MSQKTDKQKDDVPASEVEVVDDTAAKAEANGDDTVTVHWDGEDWVVPTNRRDWDVDAMVAVEEGKYFVFLKTLLGPAQWRKFTAKKRTVGQADDLTGKIVSDALGADQGE